MLHIANVMMKNALLSAVTMLAIGASAASADNSSSVRTISAKAVVRNLQRQAYRHISQPVRDGRFYAVKVVSPRGHKVKLYIDAHDGRIVDVKPWP